MYEASCYRGITITFEKNIIIYKTTIRTTILYSTSAGNWKVNEKTEKGV